MNGDHNRRQRNIYSKRKNTGRTYKMRKTKSNILYDNIINGFNIHIKSKRYSDLGVCFK